MKRQQIVMGLWLIAASVTASAAGVVDFEEFVLEPQSHWGGPGSGETGFSSGGVFFPHNDGFFSWDGFVYSNRTDAATPGYGNQYSAVAGGGLGGTGNYVIGCFTYDWLGDFDIIPMAITPAAPAALSGAYFTNTTYAYWAMKSGESPARAFGQDDYLKLLITGLDAQGRATQTVEFYLGKGDNIIDDWTWVDLSALGTVSKIEFSIVGSDVHPIYGLNTPAYFAMDNLTFIPEPATLLLLTLGSAIFATARRTKK